MCPESRPHSFASIPLPHFPARLGIGRPNCAFDRHHRARYVPACENVRHLPPEPRDRRLAGGARGAGRDGGGRVRLHGARRGMLLRQPGFRRDRARGSAADPLRFRRVAPCPLRSTAGHCGRLRAGCKCRNFVPVPRLPRARGRSDFPSELRPTALIGFLPKPVVCPDAVRQGVLCPGVEADWLCELSPCFFYWRCRWRAAWRRRSIRPRIRRASRPPSRRAHRMRTVARGPCRSPPR